MQSSDTSSNVAASASAATDKTADAAQTGKQAAGKVRDAARSTDVGIAAWFEGALIGVLGLNARPPWRLR